MADVIIRGMEMPTEQRMEVLIFKNGFVAYYDVYGHYIGQAKAVPLPEGHGRLVDKAAFEADVRKRYCHGCNNSNGLKCRACWVDDMLGEVEDAPTIVPAEGGTDNG